MFKILILILILTPNRLLAKSWTGINECGLYKVVGKVRHVPKKGLKIVVNESTQSEIIISVPIRTEPTLAPFIDKDILATVYFNKNKMGSEVNGNVTTIISRLPKPLNIMDTGITFISKGKCND